MNGLKYNLLNVDTTHLYDGGCGRGVLGTIPAKRPIGGGFRHGHFDAQVSKDVMVRRNLSRIMRDIERVLLGKA